MLSLGHLFMAPIKAQHTPINTISFYHFFVANQDFARNLGCILCHQFAVASCTFKPGSPISAGRRDSIQFKTEIFILNFSQFEPKIQPIQHRSLEVTRKFDAKSDSGKRILYKIWTHQTSRSDYRTHEGSPLGNCRIWFYFYFLKRVGPRLIKRRKCG